MEYFINVYTVARYGKNHTSIEHWETRDDAIEDISLRLNMKNSPSKYTYIHSIRVMDDLSLIVDLSGELS